MPLPIADTVPALRAQIALWKKAGETVALVPTMGALHEGHLALVRRAKAVCAKAVVSIFVNPTQFGPNEDYGRYPRQEAKDAQLLASAGADLLYLPPVEAMYPRGFSTTITVDGVSKGLCGDFRPIHFAGVATVVAKLLLQSGPDRALFGEKDYQQLQVIKRLVIDLDIPVAIEGVPTVREADGLAMSSRNAYLSPAERAIAARMNVILGEVAGRAKGGEWPAQAAQWGRAELEKAGFTKIDYLEIRDAESLVALERLDRPARVLAAAWLGKTRLIDNRAVG